MKGVSVVDVVAPPDPSPVDVGQLGEEISSAHSINHAFQHGFHRASIRSPGPLRLPVSAAVSLKRLLTLSANRGFIGLLELPARCPDAV